MKTIAALITFCLLLLPIASSNAATPDEVILRGLEQSWATAASVHDEPTLDKLLDNSYTEVTANGLRRTKADLLAAPPLPVGGSQSIVDVKVQVTNDVAVVTGVNYFVSAPGALASKFLFTDVYARRSDGWRAISSNMTRATAD